MGRNTLELIEWQLYWKKWHLGRAWDYDDEFGIRYLYIFIGPLQMRFYA